MRCSSAADLPDELVASPAQKHLNILALIVFVGRVAGNCRLSILNLTVLVRSCAYCGAHHAVGDDARLEVAARGGQVLDFVDEVLIRHFGALGGLVAVVSSVLWASSGLEAEVVLERL